MIRRYRYIGSSGQHILYIPPVMTSRYGSGQDQSKVSGVVRFRERFVKGKKSGGLNARSENKGMMI